MFSLTFLFDFLDCLMAARWPLCLRALNICIMIVNVNNKAVETSASTLSQLVEELHLPENGVAVGVDNRMVPRATWHEYQLSEGMNLVIIKAACGG